MSHSAENARNNGDGRVLSIKDRVLEEAIGETVNPLSFWPRPIRVMKFGGTSVGNAHCIRKVAEIVRCASHDSGLVVVVSAMSGVTNKLIEVAFESEKGNERVVADLVQQLRRQHEDAVKDLIPASEKQRRISQETSKLFDEGVRLCQGTILLRELTPRVRDAISSLGERLSVLLVATALNEIGVESAAIPATELVVTDSSHGAADPWLDLTRERCVARLHPLLQQGIVPVVTGFIGATAEGVLTTLGRGGSDYSATILGAVLEAEEVVIWTDVDGLLTADPRLVPEACIIPEVSYREAAELAYFGAKVLHPKTLRPVLKCGIPLRIRNTFAPEKPGTRITPNGASDGEGVTAIAVVSDAALITMGGPGVDGISDVLGRTLAMTRELRTDVLLVSQASSRNDICLVVPANGAKQTLEELRREFSEDLTYERVERIVVDSAVAVVTVVGKKMRNIPGIMGRIFGALERLSIEILSIAHGTSESNISFVIAKRDVEAALLAVHRELGLGSLTCAVNAKEVSGNAVWHYPSPNYRAEAD
jgi:bifunctional aspartokinase / homoserine dehydrogenase 1